jgi:hypothetical protein
MMGNSLLLMLPKRARHKIPFRKPTPKGDGAPGVYRLPGSHIIITVVFLSLVFEGILPKMSTKFVADILDVVAYIAGAFFSGSI